MCLQRKRAGVHCDGDENACQRQPHEGNHNGNESSMLHNPEVGRPVRAAPFGRMSGMLLSSNAGYFRFYDVPI